ncbi:WAS/WASL-interacting protein family member 1 isoform X2 [Drosophila gunungcola]|uniref:WAS/WASL-interacting protein family member 1 isoform X2 n=1 Tax=Drosophila gunungcola TaxID=103775 RepID=UPI0022E31E32|nr:WAS/WASL-interacting protein family member 1 isoform X2 [Drosophila gunungcola]
MSENEDVEAAPVDSAGTTEESGKDETPKKPLPMSFADWKKCKEALKPESKGGPQRSNNNSANYNNNNNNNNGRKQWSSNDNRNFQGGGGPRNDYQDRNNYPPLSRPPPLPMQLMNMGFGGNFGPGPCGPPMGGHPMGPGGPMGFGGPPCGPGPRRNQNQRPLQPPPFWEDMMSPQHRPPPIQPPMPKCPSLWNLVPKERGQQQNNQHSNKKFKSNNSGNKVKDSKLMPPPPPPTSNNGNNSQSNGEAQPSKKPKRSGTFVQVNGQWIQKPEAPLPLEDAPPGTKEERQRQWKEYRMAMKPFKNREFHNWKRTVQRLGKLPREQLDEQQLERLEKAEEYIGAHKAMLTVKHAERWVQQDNKNEKSQLFLRKSPNVGSWELPKDKPPNGYQSTHDFKKQQMQKFFGTGRAIKGGADLSVIGHLAPPPPPPDTPPQTNNYWPGGSAINATGSNSNPSFFSHYSNNFVKGGTMLPP